jgi:hypothetical protein
MMMASANRRLTAVRPLHAWALVLVGNLVSAAASSTSRRCTAGVLHHCGVARKSRCAMHGSDVPDWEPNGVPAPEATGGNDE